MTSVELKHQAKAEVWRKRIVDEYSGPKSITNPVGGNQHSGETEIIITVMWESAKSKNSLIMDSYASA
jgi:hypothetical protein